MSSKSLGLKHVSHRFGPVEVLSDVSLEIAAGELVAIVGPSGCGKTTLLNLLARVERPTAGAVHGDARTRTVHQRDGLFPWLTVAENIRLGLRHLADERRREDELREMLTLIGLEEFRAHYPRQLSGGMRQRVELARALAGETDALLLDEPFSALDYLTRLRLRSELARLLRERPRTVVLVTHDIEEAAQLADRVVLLTERPARVRGELGLTSPRPRSPVQEDVVRATREILAEMGVEQEAANRPREDALVGAR